MTQHDEYYQDLVEMVGADGAAVLSSLASKLTRDVDILVFASPTCRACPHQINSVAALTLAAPTVAAEVVDTSQEPELAAQYEVRAVPTTVIDDEVILTGVTPPLQLLERLLTREGPEGERSVFHSWMETARIQDAADHLVFTPHPETTAEIFADLWSNAEWEERRSLIQIVGTALGLAPDGLPDLAQRLAAAQKGPATDEEWDEDTRDLLELLSR